MIVYFRNLFVQPKVLGIARRPHSLRPLGDDQDFFVEVVDGLIPKLVLVGPY